ncbi:MAG: CBS domain-containing protein [Candidatus Methanofastidiosia archaeon]
MKIAGIVKSPTFIDAHDHATKSRQLLRKEKILFVKKDNRFEGIIDRTTILKITGSKSTLNTVDIAKLPTYVATPEEDVTKVAKNMLKHKTYVVPVVEKADVKGYVEMIDIIAILALENEIASNKKLSDVMRKEPITLNSEDSIVMLWNVMEKLDFSGIPIIEIVSTRRGKYKKLVGYISKKDILNSGNVRIGLESEKGRFINPPKVKKIMNRTPIVLSPDDDVSKFVEYMVRYDVSRIPLVDEHYELEGLVGKMDILKLFIEGKT